MAEPTASPKADPMASPMASPKAELGGLRAALADPQARLRACFVSLPRVEIVEMFALAGVDLVILDGEHGAFGVGDLAALVTAGQARGARVIVRVVELGAPVISAALDAGADGILVPHIRGPQDAAAAVAAARFPPVGSRSIHGAVPAARYGTRPDYLTWANESCAVIVMCEDAEALGVIEQTVAVPGVDAVFVGSFDLSASMGFVGAPGHDSVTAASRGVLEAARGADIAFGVMAPAAEDAVGWFGEGARFVAVGVDAAIIVGGVRDVLARSGAGAGVDGDGAVNR